VDPEGAPDRGWSSPVGDDRRDQVAPTVTVTFDVTGRARVAELAAAVTERPGVVSVRTAAGGEG
jgi:hypothetical protein